MSELDEPATDIVDIVDIAGPDGIGGTRQGTPAPRALSGVRFAVIDVETSGLSVRRHRVLQVGLVVVDGDGTVLDRWSSLVRPRVPWLHHIGPRHIHGLQRRSLATAPPARAVLSELAHRVAGCVVVGHNASFDVTFLRRAYRRAGLEVGDAGFLCTLDLSRRLDPDRCLSHRLTDVCARYGVELARPHDALEDAGATAAIVHPLLRANGVYDTASLRALLRS